MNSVVHRINAQPPAPKRQNPWQLTLTQVDVMDAMCEIGRPDRVARRLKMRMPTIRSHTRDVRKRMGVDNTILATLLWDRWRQTDGRGVPA